MKNTSVAENIKQTLHQDLAKIGQFDECALLDYPEERNIGDHLIWLGEVFYLTDICKTKIKYASGISDFSTEEMEKQVGNAPIFLTGGGNLGDLWSLGGWWTDHQNFREYIISRYQDRAIIIMPQSIYFTNADNLERAAKIFNSHPNLTLFVREQNSYEIALKYFDNCQVLKTTDMAFHLANTVYLKTYDIERESSILYHCRHDAELNKDISSAPIFTLPNVVTDDWISLQFEYWEFCESTLNNLQFTPNNIQIRSIDLMQWILQQLQQTFDLYSFKLNSLHNPKRHRTSLGMMHCGIYQFKQQKMIITNRLHGHIMCIILGIPHIFLANFYHKNESFYESWTHQVPFCRFVKNSSEILPFTYELMENYCQS
ncbi:MAG: polysaccharide pyruvyl transferase family protein [Nostoc sp. S4]|nr:polysaccharide pyruvyl transferase family protein [Nostoc sp. S4]